MQILLFFFWTIPICWCIIQILYINNSVSSLRVIKIRQFSLAVYRNLRHVIDSKLARKIAKMKASIKRSYLRTQRWKRRTETAARRIQRRQREVLRAEVQILVNSFGFNLDVLGLIIKLSLFIIFIFSFAYFTNYRYIVGLIWIRIYCFIIFLWITHLIFSRLILRDTRMWFWKPWPAIYPIYSGGYFPYRIELILIIFYFIPNIIWTCLALFIMFLAIRINHTYLMRFTYNVICGYLRSILWMFLSDGYIWYVANLKPTVLFLTKIFKPILKKILKKIPRFRLPPGWSWM